jgi:hypothetical protein
VNKKFSTRYYLNLVLIDEENRRYFKQQVIFYSPKSAGLPPLIVYLLAIGDYGVQNTRGAYKYGTLGPAG